ncbi:ABC transporter permease [Longispora fulva]|nr:ABC transporter permease [Longispora fulva]
MEERKSGSAYPWPMDELHAKALNLAVELGEVPSRNRLMAELRIGAPKAIKVREALEDSGLNLTAANRALKASGRIEWTSPTEVPDFLASNADTAETVPTDTHPEPGSDTTEVASADSSPVAATVQVDEAGHPDTVTDLAEAESPRRARRVRSWPVLLLALPAFVAIWSGWVGLGELTGFGVVHPLPGLWDDAKLNTAITLPIGVETYAAYALRAWLSGSIPIRARRFAKWSAIGSLVLGAAGQVAYHLMSAAGVTEAPWPITTAVACLPVAVLGMGAALAHLMHNTTETNIKR